MLRFKRFLVPVAVGAALLLGACADNDPSPTPTPTPTETSTPSPTASPDGTPATDPAGGGISPATPDEPPVGTFEVNGTEHPLRLGTYCWSPPTGSGRSALCVDAIGVITPLEPARVPSGGTLQVTGGLMMPPIEFTAITLWVLSEEPAHTGDEFLAWHPTDQVAELQPVDGAVTLPADLEPGRYLLTVDIMSIDVSSTANYGTILEVE